MLTGSNVRKMKALGIIKSCLLKNAGQKLQVNYHTTPLRCGGAGWFKKGTPAVQGWRIPYFPGEDPVEDTPSLNDIKKGKFFFCVILY